MTDPKYVAIFIGGMLAEGYISMNLERHKKDMTGSLTVVFFWGYLPNQPVIRAARAGAPIMVYIGGHLAFIGTVDSRTGGGDSGKGKGKGGGNSTHFSSGKGRAKSVGSGHQAGGGAGVTSHAGPNSYIVTIKARGKAKNLIDSSHEHKTGTITNAKTKDVIEQLVAPHGIPVDWRAQVMDMDKWRGRAGATVQNEVNHVSNEYGYHGWETRDGMLRISDIPGPEMGEPLILGWNIWEFEAQQSEHERNSEITVQGQRTKRNIRGKKAVMREKKIADPAVTRHAPYKLQHNTDATDEALQKRAKFEADNRASESLKVKIKTFHVMGKTGMPWDVGMLHLVVIPTEGIGDVLECTSLSYTVDAKKHLHTMLTLSVPAGMGGGLSSVSGGMGAMPGYSGSSNDGSALAALSAQAQMQQLGKAALAEAGVTLVPGLYPEPWAGPAVQELAIDVVASAARSAIDDILAKRPPLVLPDAYLDPKIVKRLT